MFMEIQWFSQGLDGDPREKSIIISRSFHYLGVVSSYFRLSAPPLQANAATPHNAKILLRFPLESLSGLCWVSKWGKTGVDHDFGLTWSNSDTPNSPLEVNLTAFKNDF